MNKLNYHQVWFVCIAAMIGKKLHEQKEKQKNNQKK
jgi:hypothetical protein